MLIELPLKKQLIANLPSDNDQIHTQWVAMIASFTVVVKTNGRGKTICICNQSIKFKAIFYFETIK